MRIFRVLLKILLVFLLIAVIAAVPLGLLLLSPAFGRTAVGRTVVRYPPFSWLRDFYEKRWITSGNKKAAKAANQK